MEVAIFIATILLFLLLVLSVVNIIRSLKTGKIRDSFGFIYGKYYPDKGQKGFIFWIFVNLLIFLFLLVLEIVLVMYLLT